MWNFIDSYFSHYSVNEKNNIVDSISEWKLFLLSFQVVVKLTPQKSLNSSSSPTSSYKTLKVQPLKWVFFSPLSSQGLQNFAAKCAHAPLHHLSFTCTPRFFYTLASSRYRSNFTINKKKNERKKTKTKKIEREATKLETIFVQFSVKNRLHCFDWLPKEIPHSVR